MTTTSVGNLERSSRPWRRASALRGRFRSLKRLRHCGTDMQTALVACFAAGLLAGCRAPAAPPTAKEPPTLNVTNWTERTELYMEYPPLVAGQQALFAVHLTRLADFKPVAAGQARVEFTTANGGQPKALVGT